MALASGSSSSPNSGSTPGGVNGHGGYGNGVRMPTQATGRSRYARNASIVLIGMRGVGKRTLTLIASKALGRQALSADAIFEAQAGQTISAFIHAYGWDAFRARESQILGALLLRHPTDKIVVCGGGVVELPQNREMLREFGEVHGPVIHVLREKDVVLRYLDENKHFPAYLYDTAAEAWDRREILYRQTSSHEFVSLTVPSLCSPSRPPSPSSSTSDTYTLSLKPVEADFLRLLRFIHGVDTNHAPLGPHAPRTYFLALTYPDVAHALPVLEDISVGVDALELRVDLLAHPHDPTFLAFQVATLRRHSDLPIVFTVRTAAQGGHYPTPTDEAALDRLEFLMYHALRLGVEYLDIEIVTFPPERARALVQAKGNTVIIGSYHDGTARASWTAPETMVLYEQAVGLGADIVKICYTARTFEDNLALRTFARTVQPRGVPLMAINVGPEGKISRVLNPVLSPVSHPLLPTQSAPGQISFAESQQILYLTGLLHAREFYLFGRPIQHSLSPVIQNTAFAEMHFPHKYALHETRTVEELRAVMARPEFGGASVTIPYKRDIMPYLHHVSAHAQAIGAVNTVIPTSSGLYGENTDWLAIKKCIARSLAPALAVTSCTTALVLGAGGTSRAAIYALLQLGVVNIFLHNRTRAKGEQVKREFEDPARRLDDMLTLTVLDSLDPAAISPPPTIILSTIPGVPVDAEDTRPPDLGLTPALFAERGGVAVELAYAPRMTRLLELAGQAKGWTQVEGVEVLLEQGYEQFRLWTGRRAPKRIVRERVMHAFDNQIVQYTF